MQQHFVKKPILPFSQWRCYLLTSDLKRQKDKAILLSTYWTPCPSQRWQPKKIREHKSSHNTFKRKLAQPLHIWYWRQNEDKCCIIARTTLSAECTRWKDLSRAPFFYETSCLTKTHQETHLSFLFSEDAKTTQKLQRSSNMQKFGTMVQIADHRLKKHITIKIVLQHHCKCWSPLQKYN